MIWALLIAGAIIGGLVRLMKLTFKSGYGMLVQRLIQSPSGGMRKDLKVTTFKSFCV